MSASPNTYSNIERRRAISPVSVADNTAAVSQIIDMQGFGACAFAIATGSLGDAGAEFTVLVEDGENSSLNDNAAVSDDFLVGTEAAASFIQSDDNEIRVIEYIGHKRYVRLTITPTNNGTASLITAIAELSNPRHGPVTANA